MTQEEKDQMNQKRMERLRKDNKGRLTIAIVLPAVGLILTVILGLVSSNRQGEIGSATILDDMSVGEFLDNTYDGSAIYTGTIYAEDPVTVKWDEGNYIMMRRTIEQEERVPGEEDGKYTFETTTVSDKSKHCERIVIDDVTVDYDAFRDLPKHEDVDTQGSGDIKNITKYTYISDGVDGTFYIKCKDGDIKSIEYYLGEDVAGQNSRMFGLAIVLIWLIILAADIFLLVKFFSMKKVIQG